MAVPETSIHRRIAAGTVAGGLAGLLLACFDFGASWLWLPDSGDRAIFLLRLVALQAPLGALLGALLASFSHFVDRSLVPPVAKEGVSLPAASRVLPWLLLVTPLIVWVVSQLFSGGKMSRLPYRSGLMLLVGGVLAGGFVVAFRLARTVYFRWSTDRRAASAIGLVLIGLAYAMSKVDQYVLPNLYDYLHGVLTILGFVTLSFAAVLIGRGWGASPGGARVAVLAPVAAAGLLIVNGLTLDYHLNVRVALLDARAPNSRSIMLASRPLLFAMPEPGADFEMIERARAARERRLQESPEYGLLPVHEGAHVLLLSIDALRADHLGTYGYERDISPNLDALAEDSVVFEMAYAQAPHSSYSLSSVMTSEYLRETVGLGLPIPSETLPSILRLAAYHTAGFYTQGIFHTEGERMALYRDNHYGFARYDHSNVDAETKTNQVLAEVDRILERGEPPSFLWVHYFDVHEPYEDTSLGTSDIDRYDGEIRKTDREIGRLLEGLRARFERPLIIAVIADHGEEFRDHGGLYHGSTLYQEQIRSPLFIHAPEIEHRRVNAPVELIDVAPTLMELVGIPAGPAMRGTDLRPMMLGLTDEVTPVFASVTHKRMVVRWPYKLVADLRFNLYELYNLEEDPRERRNLAGSEPELLRELQGEVYAWLDAMQQEGTNPHETALHRGRLGDRRAVPELAVLVADRAAPEEERIEAIRLLTLLADQRAAPTLAEVMRRDEGRVSAEAAIALGRQRDERAQPMLVSLIGMEDPNLRTRAAISLARLRDRAAVPGLIDALWVSSDNYDRREAIRWLGQLQDPSAVEPLIGILPETQLRYLTVVALGRIGDVRAYEPLVRTLEWEELTSVRDGVARGLGYLGDRRAIAPLLRMVRDEPDLQMPSESLVRLGALESGEMGGVDMHPEMRGRRIFERCEAGDADHEWNYLHRTWCVTRRDRVRLRLPLPQEVSAEDGYWVLVRARRADDPGQAHLRVRLGGELAGTVPADGEWNEHRFFVPPDTHRTRPHLDAELSLDNEEARLGIDHVLVIPAAAGTSA